MTGCNVNIFTVNLAVTTLGGDSSALIPAAFIGLGTVFQIFWVGPIIGGASAALIYDFILAPRSSDLTDRMKVWTSGQVEEYDLEGDDMNSRVEMKPK